MRRDTSMAEDASSLAPSVSFIIAAYNVADYIGRTVESVLNQTVPPKEVIVIDDGSTDRTADVARRAAEESQRPELLTIIRQQNAGVSVARNVGLDAATADYVVFVDGDDWVERNLIERITPTLATGPDMVHWRVGFLDESDVLLVEVDNAWHRDWPRDGWEVLRLRTGGLVRGSFVITGGTAFRLGFLDNQEIRFQRGCQFGEDSEFVWECLAYAGAVEFIDARLASYYYRVGSLSRTVELRRFQGPAGLFRAAAVIESRVRPDAHEIADRLRDQACSRYVLYVYPLSTFGDRGHLIRKVEQMTPGLSEQVRAHLRRKPSPRWRERLFATSPAALLTVQSLHRGVNGLIRRGRNT